MAFSSIVSAVKDVQWPADKQQLLQQCGDREIEIVEGQTMPLRDLLNACSHDRYENERDLTACPEIVDKIDSIKAEW